MRWPEARTHGRAGAAIRREGWMDRWLTYDRALWFLTIYNPVTGLFLSRRVVQAADFRSPEFFALDWTLDPPPGIDPDLAGADLFAVDFILVRYSWTAANGTDLDTRTALLGTGGAPDGVDLGYSRYGTDGGGSGAIVGPPGGTVADGPFYLHWGGDNTSGVGQEAVVMDCQRLIGDFPSALEFRLRLRAHWFGTRVDGDLRVEVAAYTGGAMEHIPLTRDFMNTTGEESGRVEFTGNVQSRPSPSDDGYDLGAVVFDPALGSAAIEEAI